MTGTLFTSERVAFACPGEFCQARCGPDDCKCKPCWCDTCKRRRILARRPTDRPRVRYTPTASHQAPLFANTARSLKP